MRDNPSNSSVKRNTILNIIKTCSTVLYPLITFPYALRVLQPENIGKVNFAQSYLNYFMLIAMLGIQTYAIRECASVKYDKDKLSETASQIFSINVISSLIAYLALFASIIFFCKLDDYRLLIIIESFTIIFNLLGADWLNSAMEDFAYITVRTLAIQIIAIIAMFVFVRVPNDYYKYAVILLSSSSGAYLLNIWYRRRYCKVRFTLSIDWKKHLSPIIFLFVMNLSQAIFNNTDVTMLELMKGDYEVGLYTSAQKITRIISQVVQSMALVIIPRLSIYFSANDFENANRILRKVLLFNITLGLPCVIGVEMMANDIIYLVGGESYIAAVPVIRVLILSFLFSLVGGSFLGNAVLIPMRQEKYYMVVCLITAAVNIVVNALLIPGLGAVGASISTALNGFLIFLLLLFRVDKRIKVERLLQVFFGPVIGCIAILLCCYFCYSINNILYRVIVSVSSSIILYGLILLITKNEFANEAITYIHTRFDKGGH